MSDGAIRNHVQARTAEQYLEALEHEILDEDISLMDLQYKRYEMQVIQIELDHFHEHRAIRLVVDNDIEEKVTC